MKPEPKLSDLLSVNEVAALTGLTPSTVRTYICRGHFVRARSGPTLISRAAVDHYLKHRQPVGPPFKNKTLK